MEGGLVSGQVRREKMMVREREAERTVGRIYTQRKGQVGSSEMLAGVPTRLRHLDKKDCCPERRAEATCDGRLVDGGEIDHTSCV